MPKKLVESYVEFFAKGLQEVEAQTKELAESSGNAHKAVDILSARFKTLYDKTLKQGITTVDTLFDHQKKIDNLFKKNEGMTKFIVDQQKLEKLQEVFNKTLDIETIKLKALDKEFLALSVAEHKLTENAMQANKALGMQVRAEILATGAAKDLMQAEIKLQAEESALILQEKKLAATLLASDVAYRKNAIEIHKTAQAEKILSMESQLLINKMTATDQACIKLAKDEMILTKELEQSAKRMSLNVQALMLKSGATVQAIKADKDLFAEETKLVTKIAEVNANLMKTDSAFAQQSLAFKQAADQQKLYEMQSDLVIAKMAALDTVSIALAAAHMNNAKEIENENKKLELQARKANITTGELRKLLAAQIALEKQEKKVAAREANQKTLAQYGTIIGSLKIMRDSMKFFETATLKALGVTLRLAVGVAKIGGRGIMAAAGYVANKFKSQPKADQPAKIAIDTTSAPAAEKFTDRMMAKLGKLQTLALVAGGAIGGYVASFTAAASSNTLEAERLGLAYEYAGRMVGDMFAPYVRLTTDLINKFTAYWKSLSAELKSSIAMWSMVAGGVATLVASLPVLISIVSAVVGAFVAMLSPIALVGIAIAGIAVYLSGVAEAGITMEKRITRAVRAVLDVFSLVQTVAESIWETLGPVFQNIVDGATTAFNWVLKQLGLVGEDGEKTSTMLGSSFSSAMLKCMEYFNKFKTFVMQIIQSIASTWKSWTDNFALGLAAIAEKAGIVAQGTSKTLWDINNEGRKKFDEDQRKAMADMEKSNKDAMDRMRERLNQNKDKADEIAGPLIKMFKGLQSGKGFQMKMNVAFEGLQGTFDRLQQAFAQQVGPNIEQAQLVQLQGIHNNMQVAASSLTNIKDKIPAVR